jgi:hypothetical protein
MIKCSEEAIKKYLLRNILWGKSAAAVTIRIHKNKRLYLQDLLHWSIHLSERVAPGVYREYAEYLLFRLSGAVKPGECLGKRTGLFPDYYELDKPGKTLSQLVEEINEKYVHLVL